MSTHTPGPWSVKGTHYGDQFRAESIEPNICEMVSSRSPEETTANARLIAASPDLYEALREIIAEWDARDLNDTGGIALARAALAKAEGRARPCTT